MDELTPKYFRILSLGMEKQGDDVVANYHIAIHNVLGNVMSHINQSSVLTEQEKAAVVAIYLRDEVQFEAATGLEKWVPPPPEEP